MTMKLSFDGHGINDDDEYRTRIATFTGGIGHEERTKKYGPMFKAAPAMLEALREIVAEQDARTPSQGTIYRDTGGMILARAAIAQAEEGGR
jgi:hypothetical protein